MRQHQNVKIIFGKNLQKRSKIDKSEHQYKILHIQICLIQGGME